MNLESEEHHRRSIRLRGYDYSAAGGYYATVVAFRRECLFGEVVEGEMRLNDLGRVVREEWFRSAEIRKEIHLEEDEFIVIPNHIHGIIWIYDVGADGVRPDSKQQIVKPTGFNLARGTHRARGASLRPYNDRRNRWGHLLPDSRHR